MIGEWSLTDLAIAIPLAILCGVASAFFSGAEVALFSIRRVEREQLANAKRFADRRISRMLTKPRRLIATVLVGNEAFNSLLAVIVFITLERWYAPWSAFSLAIAIALPGIVLITDVTAKTLAANAPLAWSRLFVLPLSVIAVVIAPVRFVVQIMTSILLEPFGVVARPRPARDLSEEEFRTLVDAGSAQGQVDARERRLIHRVFEFSDKNVGQVMTPRERIFALSYDLPAQRLVKELAARGFSRVPIYQKSLDNVRGILNAKDLVRTTSGQPLGRPLGELLHEPLFVPRTTPVKRLFLTFKQKKVHMAIVVSEYGKVLGLVTMDDLLSQIFGVLRDERAELQSSVGQRRTSARTPLEVKPGPDAGGAALAPRDPAAPGAASAGAVGDDLGRAKTMTDDRDQLGGDANAPSLAMRDAALGDSAVGERAAGDAARGADGVDVADGADGAADGANDGLVHRGDGTARDGLVHRGDDAVSGPVPLPDSSLDAALDVLDPPAPRPLYDVDEVTPPAIDLHDLVRTGSGGDGDPDRPEHDAHDAHDARDGRDGRDAERPVRESKSS